MHLLEFVRKEENFTMEQKITYKKKQGSDKAKSQSQCTKPSFVSHKGSGEEWKERREYNVVFSHDN